MRNRAYFMPAGQVDNLGDQLINMATLDAMRPHAEIVVDDLATPGWFVDAIARQGDLRFSSISSRRFYLNLARKIVRERLRGEAVRNFIVLPPGHTSRHGARQARAACGRYLRLLFLRMLGCRIVRAGLSIGPFDRLNAIVESAASRVIGFYGLRDQASLALARRYRFADPQYFPDLAWNGPFERPSRDHADGPVVLSFRSNAFGQVHSSRYLAPIRQRLRQLLGSPPLHGRPIVVAYQVQADAQAARELFEDLRDAGHPVELLIERLDLSRARGLYREAFCVLSNRLHVLLMAAQSGGLPIAVVQSGDNDKITSMLVDNGLEGLALRLDVDASGDLETLNRILDGRDLAMERIDRVRCENARRISEGVAAIFQPATSRRGAARSPARGEVR